jgi:hypothetical protein
MAQQQDSNSTSSEKTPQQCIPADRDQLQRQLEQRLPKRTEEMKADAADEDDKL